MSESFRKTMYILFIGNTLKINYEDESRLLEMCSIIDAALTAGGTHQFTKIGDIAFSTCNLIGYQVADTPEVTSDDTNAAIAKVMQTASEEIDKSNEGEEWKG